MILRPQTSLLAVGLAASLLFCLSCSSQKGAQGPRTMPPVPVTATAAKPESVPVEIRAVGTVEPYSTVDVKSQIAGQLMAVRFTEGGMVKKGDLLFMDQLS